MTGGVGVVRVARLGSSTIAGVENFLWPFVAIRERAGAGHAAFAEQALPRGTVVAAFGGTATRGSGLRTYSADRVSRSIQIDDDLFLVGPETTEPGDCINHSCTPNCGMRNATQVITMRDITPGEELTFDYAMTDSVPYDEFACTCGTAECRQYVRADDWKNAALRERYDGWFAPHVARRIAAEQRARQLTKRDVEHLLGSYDADPVAALTTALRIATGRVHASWESLIGLLPDASSLARGETASFDRLAAEMNETRSVRLDDGVGHARHES